MRLEDITVVVRPRTLGQLHDLALLLLRRHAGRAGMLGVIGVAPWVLLDGWLLVGVQAPGVAIWWLWVLAYAQAGLATAPLTAFLGEAMFSPTPSARRALGTALRSIWPLSVHAVARGFAALTVIGLLLSPPHSAEVVLLERQGLGASWSRSQALRKVWLGEHMLHLLIAGLLVVLGAWLVVGTAGALTGILRSADPMPGFEDGAWWPSDSWLPVIAVWLVAIHLATVRFVAYIDLRTRHEGWDVELDLRQAGRRVAGAVR